MVGGVFDVRIRCIAAIAAMALCTLPAFSSAQAPNTNPDTPLPGMPETRESEPVILNGESFPDWSINSNTTARPPFMDLVRCKQNIGKEECESHNTQFEGDVDTSDADTRKGTAVDQLLGYRWDPGTKKFVQVPFQVDEVFTRYLANDASGFAIYSGEDQHTTYAYQREGYRFTESGPSDNPCLAQMKPGERPILDPVKGLDHNDEVAFMPFDAGPPAPEGTKLPDGIEASRAVSVRDPLTPTAADRVVYVMKAKADGPKAAFDHTNGHVSYKRDAASELFEKSQSSYDGYGNAGTGVHCDRDGKVLDNGKVARRRPRDYATITTPRYRFRYDGRWLMTELQISEDFGKTYGPDLIDRWKARAFAQDPASETPCCGYEEEDTNWGGSSTLLGEKVGPVRAIRETWGADSGTNVTRRETFYRDTIRQKTWLRVHPIPPLDGIYAQWDFNAGRMTKFFNSKKPDGVPIDGWNDETMGNLDDPCNDNYDPNDTGQVDQGYRSAYEQFGFCADFFASGCKPGPTTGLSGFEFCKPDDYTNKLQACATEQECGTALPYHQSIDVTDPTFNEANIALNWSQTTGPHGTVIDRVTAGARDLTPGGAAQSAFAVPYYRDDSCFDDGTGTNPGPKVKLRSGDEPRTAADGTARRCWNHSADGKTRVNDPVVDGDDHFFQGSIGTHGLHVLLVAESDNAARASTVPITEMVSDWRMLMLPREQPGSVGKQVGKELDQPVQPTPAPGEPDREEVGDGGVAGSSAKERCLVSKMGATGRRIGVTRIGTSRRAIERRTGKPGRKGSKSFRYCVKGGGRLLVSFNDSGAAWLVASTATGHEARGISRGDSLRTLKRTHRGLKRYGRRYWVKRSSKLVFGVKNGRVRFVAAAHPKILRDRYVLKRYVRRIGL